MACNSDNRKIMCKLTDYVVFDLETTGLSAVFDKIIEISAVKVVGGKIVDEYSTLVNPNCHIPDAARMVNNISDEMVMNAPCLSVALKEFKDFVGDMVLVGHNIKRFDMKFMDRDYMDEFSCPVLNSYLDTLELAKLCFPDFKSRKLGILSEYFGIDTAGAHRALADCRMNQQVFEKMAEIYFTEVDNG